MPDWSVLWSDITTRVALIGGVAVIVGAVISSLLLILNSWLEHTFKSSHEKESSLLQKRMETYARVLHAIRNFHPEDYKNLDKDTDPTRGIEFRAYGKAINESMSEAALITNNIELRNKLMAAARSCAVLNDEEWVAQYKLPRGAALYDLEQCMRKEIGIPLMAETSTDSTSNPWLRFLDWINEKD